MSLPAQQTSPWLLVTSPMGSLHSPRNCCRRLKKKNGQVGSSLIVFIYLTKLIYHLVCNITSKQLVRSSKIMKTVENKNKNILETVKISKKLKQDSSMSG